MGAFAKLATGALLKILKKNRAKLQVLDDLSKGKNLERSAMKADPTYRAATSQLPMSRDATKKHVADSGIFGDGPMNKLMSNRPALRKEVTSMVKELRKRGGKVSSYKKPGMQKELNKMQKQKAKYIKKGYIF